MSGKQTHAAVAATVRTVPHIDLPADLPGIRGLMAYRPETALPINQLVEVLLQGPSTLTKGEREMIATRVSTLNECACRASIPTSRSTTPC